MPRSVVEVVEKGLEKVVSPLKTRVLNLRQKAVEESDIMGISSPSDDEFFNRFAAACNGAVTPLIRKQLNIFHKLERGQAKELEALGMFLWPQASGSEIRSDIEEL